ncbi:MAG: uracil-DNA glycosylase family protein, partial [Pseudomonadota bacterium]
MKKSETPPEAPRDCDVCPRLIAYRAQNSAAHPEWFNGAVPSFGDPDARLLIVGLAPGVTGANRTGRPFTGDWAGDLLYPTLAKFGLSRGLFQATPDDGIELVDCMITNAVRCVPPQNKPIGAEVNACRTFLDARIRGLPRLEHIITLVKINATGPVETSAHLLRYDSVHGRFAGEVKVSGGTMDLGRGPMQMFSTYDPSELDWSGCDVVLECTGKFNDGQKSSVHLDRGAKKVLISAPGKDVDGTFCMGVNEKDYDPASQHVISNASCTTNCLAPVAKVLHESFG